MQDEAAQRATDAMARFRRWFAVAVALGALGYLAYALVRGFDETASELTAFAWSLYVPVLALTLLNYGLRYFKWHYFLLRLGVHIPHRHNLWIFATGLAMVISPGKAGELLKPWLVRTVTGQPLTRLVPALVSERLTDAIAVLSLAAIGVSAYYAEGTNAVLGLMGAIVVGLVILAIQPLSLGIIHTIGRIGPLAGIAKKLEELYLALRTCLAPVPLVVTVVASMLAWGGECLGYYLVFQGLGATAATVDVSTFLYAFATIFGSPTPGGLGAADVALVEGSLALIDGVTSGQAVAAALLIRVATLWFGVLLGAFALLRIEGVIQSAKAEHAA